MGTSPEPPTTKEQKEVAFYAACVQAWIDTRMERDRSLLALSAGGIGLLVTLLTTVGATSPCHLLLYAAAALAFLVSIITAILIFSRNSARLEQIVKGNNEPDLTLRALDSILFGAFIIGVVLTLLVGLCSAIGERHKKGEAEMATESTKVNTRVVEPEFTRSLEGLQNLRPAATPPASGSTQGQAGAAGNKESGTPQDKK